MESIVILAVRAASSTSSDTPAWATAIGTLVLALATFVLARKTRALAISGDKTAKAAEQEIQIIRDQADATQRQSEAAEAALNASVRPLLISVPLHTLRTIQVQETPREKQPADVDVSVISTSISWSERTGRLTVPFRNVGAGVALGLAAAATVAREGPPGSLIAQGTAPSVIAAGDHDWVWFEDTPGPASTAAETPLVRLLQSDEDLVVEVAYSDVAGRQGAATSLVLTKSGRTDRAYRVARVVPGHMPRLTAELIRQERANRPELLDKAMLD